MDANPQGRMTLSVLVDHLPVRLRPDPSLNDEALFSLCALNPDLHIERAADGELLIMPPTGGSTGNRNFELNVDLGIWARQNRTGRCFDSSTGFILPNGAERSPDAAWIHDDRWNALSPDERRRFPPLCPDFVIELRSPSDRLEDLHAKLREYLENGASLGWLIDPAAKVVWLYRPGGVVERLDAPTSISGEPVLPGFALPTTALWD